MKPKNKKMLQAAMESVDLDKMCRAIANAKDDEVLGAMLTRLKNEVKYMWELATDNTSEDKYERDRATGYR